MSTKSVRIGDAWIGSGCCYIVAKIGTNHNGQVDLARQLVGAASWAGCNAVNFQRRTPKLCLPTEQRGLTRKIPWGMSSRIEAVRGQELGVLHYVDIDTTCRQHDVLWFASCEDEPAVDLIELFDPPCYKIESASLSDRRLLGHIRSMGRPIVLSTDRCTLAQLDAAVEALGTKKLVILHAAGADPTCRRDLSLRLIPALQQRYGVPVGYSVTNAGADTALAAVSLGACMVEFQLTLHCGMWGGDHAASLEPRTVARLVRELRSAEWDAAPDSTAA